MALFVGILTFNILGELANAAPNLILSNANYVKRVIDPTCCEAARNAYSFTLRDSYSGGRTHYREPSVELDDYPVAARMASNDALFSGMGILLGLHWGVCPGCGRYRGTIHHHALFPVSHFLPFRGSARRTSYLLPGQPHRHLCGGRKAGGAMGAMP